jgi:hypothetical protein
MAVDGNMKGKEISKQRYKRSTTIAFPSFVKAFLSS